MKWLVILVFCIAQIIAESEDDVDVDDHVFFKMRLEDACPKGYPCPPAMKCIPSYTCQPQESEYCQEHGSWTSSCIQDIESPELCTLQMESGMCLAYMERYGYDPESNSCKKFVFGGCGGNGNRFGTKTACENRCKH